MMDIYNSINNFFVIRLLIYLRTKKQRKMRLVNFYIKNPQLVNQSLKNSQPEIYNEVKTILKNIRQ